MSFNIKDLFSTANNYAEKFDAVMGLSDFKELKDLKKGPFKKLLNELARDIYKTAEERDGFCCSVAHLKGGKLAKKIAAHYEKLNVPISGMAEKGDTQALNRLLPEQSGAFNALCARIATLQERLIRNMVYIEYRGAKINAAKRMVRNNCSDIKDNLAEIKQAKDDGRLSLKGYEKILYWVNKK